MKQASTGRRGAVSRPSRKRALLQQAAFLLTVMAVFFLLVAFILIIDKVS